MHYVLIGQVLLWAGFLGAALTTVFRLESESNPWQTVSWPVYFGLVLVGFAGVIALRYHRAAQRHKSASSQVGIEAVLAKLKQCSEVLTERLASRIDELTCEEVLDEIDLQMVPLMSDFADDRMVIAHRLGTVAFAEIMTEFASGERYLNRAWSAAADGYVDEVTRSLKIADEFLQAAVHHAESAVRSASLRQPL